MDDLFSGTKAVDQKLKFDEQGLHDWFSKNISEFGSIEKIEQFRGCLLYTSPSPRDS